MKPDIDKKIFNAFYEFDKLLLKSEIENIKMILNKQGLKIVENTVDIPVLELLNDLMLKGAQIKRRENFWVLKDGTSVICRGETIQELLTNLILTIC